MNPITILNGSLDSIPADLLTAHLRHARKGNWLVILDYGNDLAKAHFEKGDVHIDIFSANYDLLNDHQFECDCAVAAEEIVGSFLEKEIAIPAKKIVTSLLMKQISICGTIEDFVTDMRACGHEKVRAHMAIIPSSDAKAAKLTWSIMSTLRGKADGFFERDPHARLTSATGWHAGEMTSILFVSHYRHSLPSSRVLRRKILCGLVPECCTAELVFTGHTDDFDESREVQLDLGLPGPPVHDLVIDLSDDDAFFPASPVATIIPFNRQAALPAATTPPVPVPLQVDNGPVPASPSSDDLEQLIAHEDTDATARTMVHERLDRRTILALAFGLCLLGLGFVGGLAYPDREASPAEQHWMDVSERRLAAVEAVTERSVKLSGKGNVRGPGIDRPASLPLALGSSHAAR